MEATDEPAYNPFGSTNSIMKMLSRAAKSQYTEDEVAEELGVSLESLRTLIQDRIMRDDQDLRQTSMVSFEPSDVLLLRLLATQDLRTYHG